MTNNHGAEWINSHEICDAPLPGYSDGTRNYNTRAKKAEQKCELESLKKSRQFFEERCVFDFFSGRTPSHVDFEEMAEKSLGYVERNATKEE